MSLSRDGKEVSLMEHISELNYFGIISTRADLQDYLKGFIQGGGKVSAKDKTLTANVFQQLRAA